jgi:hypothetical protein
MGPVGGPGGSFFYQGLREILKEGCGNGASLPIRAVRGNLEGVLLYCGPEGYAKDVSGNGRLSP